MKKPLAALVVLFAIAATANSVAAAETAADPILAGAEERIRTHRTAEVAIEIVGQDGKPLPGATIDVEQTGHAFLFGCNIFRWEKQSTPEAVQAYKNRYQEVFNFATLPFYWWSYERQQGEPEHQSRLEVARWCAENGIATKGHPLAWNYAEPRWLPDDSAEILRLQLRRIDDCVTRFDGLIDRWDVVNEVAHFDREHFMKRSPKLTGAWKQTGQIAFTKACFEEARAANPDATLLINDYRTDPAYERVIEGLVDDRGEPVYDVIGIQSHMHGGEWSSRKLWDTCERYKRFGVPLHFTEMTIVSGRYGWQDLGPRKEWPSTPEGEAKQAAEVERIYTILFSHPSVEAITWWDFADDGAWQGAPAGFLRKDLSPKPAYETLRRLIKDKWWTKTRVTTDQQGKAEFRAFAGKHRITIKTPRGDATEFQIEIPRGRHDLVWEAPQTSETGKKEE